MKPLHGKKEFISAARMQETNHLSTFSCYAFIIGHKLIIKMRMVAITFITLFIFPEYMPRPCKSSLTRVPIVPEVSDPPDYQATATENILRRIKGELIAIIFSEYVLDDSFVVPLVVEDASHDTLSGFACLLKRLFYIRPLYDAVMGQSEDFRLEAFYGVYCRHVVGISGKEDGEEPQP